MFMWFKKLLCVIGMHDYNLSYYDDRYSTKYTISEDYCNCCNHMKVTVEMNSPEQVKLNESVEGLL